MPLLSKITLSLFAKYGWLWYNKWQELLILFFEKKGGN